MAGRLITPSLFGALLTLIALGATPARAVSMDKSSSARDVCEMRIGAEAIQISGYQPDYSQDKFCEEFPSTGKTILTFDLETPSLRELPVEVRIVKDRNVSLADKAELAAVTEAYVTPKIYRGGTFSIQHNFKENGRFIALVTLTQPNGEKKTAQFKFAVGQSFLRYAPAMLGAVLIVGMLFVFWKHSGKRLKGAR